MHNEQPERISPQSSHRSLGPLRGELETDVSAHVFTVSAAMVGVCLTVIGIIRVSLTLNAGYSTFADDLLALNAFCFMGAAILSYGSLRSSSRKRTKRFERLADRLFVAGLLTMCTICALIAVSFF